MKQHSIPFRFFSFLCLCFLFLIALFGFFVPRSTVQADEIQPRAVYNISALPYSNTGSLSDGRPDNFQMSSGLADKRVKISLTPYSVKLIYDTVRYNSGEIFTVSSSFAFTVANNSASSVDYTMNLYEYLGVLNTPVVSLNGSTLSWSAVPNAESYNVFRDGSFFRRVNTNSVSLVLNGEPAYGDYTVIAVNYLSGYVDSARSDVVSFTAPVVTTPLDPPVVSLNGSTLSWSAVPNATNYQVWYSRQNTQQSFNRVAQTGSLSYDVAEDGFYLVTALSSDSSFSESARSNVVSYTAPVVTTPLDPPVVSLNGSTLSWSAVPNAVSYSIYYSSSLNGQFTNIANISSTSYSVSSVGYYFVVAVPASNNSYSVSSSSNVVQLGSYTDLLSPFQFIIRAANSFLSAEIFGNGFTLGSVLMFGFGLILLGFAIKIFLGG